VLQAYEEGEGSVDFIMENIMACSYEDEPRFIEIVNEAIKEGTVDVYPKWKKETSAKAIQTRKKKAEKEAKEAEELSKELEGELGKMIMQRQQNRMNGLLDKLEVEARGQSGKKGKRNEPTEEEFEAARARIEGKKQKKHK